ncbi:unnamed protein product [Effrenium voratum]|nr:unnamed protein product [Effrenium voratum]CAJ1443502.1 unnamed protein product [Effrenium voratum]
MFGVVVLPMRFFLGLRIMEDVRKLPEQLRCFDLAKAQCTCCSLGHTDGKTSLPCDRRLLLKSIRRWFSEPESPDDALARFEKLLRQGFRQEVLQCVGYGYASLGYAVYMACSGSVPILVLQLRSLRADASPEAVDQAAWFLRVLVNWAQVPLGSLFGVWMNQALCSVGVKIPLRRSLVVALLSTVTLLASAAPVALQQILLRTEPSSYLPVAYFVAWLTVTTTLFHCTGCRVERPQPHTCDVGHAGVGNAVDSDTFSI